MKIVRGIIELVMEALETIVFVGTVYVVAYLFLFQPSAVNGASMEPNFHTGDRVIANRIAYKLHPIVRGDVVVVRSPLNPEVEFIKRVIGLPQDSITIAQGKVFVNGKLLLDQFTSSATYANQGFISEGQSYQVPKDMIFVMGDNRQNSLDSRSFGPIPIGNIIGQAVYRYFPPSVFGSIKNPLRN